MYMGMLSFGIFGTHMTAVKIVLLVSLALAKITTVFLSLMSVTHNNVNGS